MTGETVMITTLIVLAGICVLSLVYILTIPSFAKTDLFETNLCKNYDFFMFFNTF